jgi:hypothetical protein
MASVTSFCQKSAALQRFQLLSANSGSRLGPAKELSNNLIIVDQHVQVDRSDRHIRVPRCVADLSQRSITCQGVRNEGVTPVMNGQRFQSG